MTGLLNAMKDFEPSLKESGKELESAAGIFSRARAIGGRAGLS
jgi:hypothetical protein